MYTIHNYDSILHIAVMKYVLLYDDILLANKLQGHMGLQCSTIAGMNRALATNASKHNSPNMSRLSDHIHSYI
jgi:hypothetical protein